MQLKEAQGNKAVFADEKQEKQKQRQSKLAALAARSRKAGITQQEKLDLLLEQQAIIIEMLEEILKQLAAQ